MNTVDITTIQTNECKVRISWSNYRVVYERCDPY